MATDRAARRCPACCLALQASTIPLPRGPVAGTQEEDPVLRLVRLHPFDRVVPFSNPATLELAEATREALKERYPEVEVSVRHLALEDPTNYFQILSALRGEFRALSESMGRGEYFVGAASGTPQMHASWVLLAASGEIPARILQVRPAVTELSLSGPEFPMIRSKSWPQVPFDPGEGKDSAAIIRRLAIVGDHPAMARALETASLLAQSDVPVLIHGESGTGKEKVASLIHHLSDRAQRLLVVVNCATIPTQLAETVLFEHARGAFTGATEAHEGKFAVADGGTLFLDEVGELSRELQAKILRAVQNGIIEPLGIRKSVTVNVRLIAATNRDLREAMSQGKFRDDLYCRLSVGEVRLPSLRERRSDIPRLAVHFLDEINLRLRKRRQFAPETLVTLQAYDWPGNVRELQNVVHRSAVLCRAVEIKPDVSGSTKTGRAAQ